MNDPLVPVLAIFAACLVFALLLVAWREQWKLAAEKSRRSSALMHTSQPFTLVVPARNAGATLGPLLQDLHGQTIYKEKSEVIVVDDDSDDGTAGIVQGMSKTWSQLRGLKNKGIGKKDAITTGINGSHGEIIILTDADSRCGPERIGRILQEMASAELDLLLLPVRMADPRGWLASIQQMELAGMVGMAAGEALMKRPGLANGANMAFSRKAFEQVEGYIDDDHASGDDVFLVERMRKAGLRIGYLVDPAAAVTVEPEDLWRGFVQQRLRWAGKMRALRGLFPWLGVLALLLPWVLIYVTSTTELNNSEHQLEATLLLVLAWLLWLYPVPALVGEVRATFGQSRSPFAALLSFLAFSIYAPIIAVSAIFVRPKWKGRVVLR